MVFAVLYLIACILVCGFCGGGGVLGFVFLRDSGLFKVEYKHDFSMHFTSTPSL